MEKTDKAFRLVVKRWVVSRGSFLRQGTLHMLIMLVATNWSERDKTMAEVLAWHNQRGQAENF